jgi:phosphoribosyl-ATP pyrophosphohydrolase
MSFSAEKWDAERSLVRFTRFSDGAEEAQVFELGKKEIIKKIYAESAETIMGVHKRVDEYWERKLFKHSWHTWFYKELKPESILFLSDRGYAYVD